MKVFLLVLGFLAAVLIVGQLVMAQLILSSGHLPRLDDRRTSIRAT